MITTNVIQRTFHLKYNNTFGTCFTIDVAKRQYLVTARHVVSGIQTSDTVQIHHEGQWKNLDVSVAWIAQNEEDIAVLSPRLQLSPTHPLEPTMGGIMLGQSVYFCGYPYGIIAPGAGFNNDFPIPLVRHGIVSAILPENGRQKLIVDGHNNPGFSGGPLIFAKPNSTDYKVAAVISGYRFEHQPVLLDGKGLGNMTVRENTGLVIAYGLKNAVDYLKENPSGVQLKETA